MPHINLRQHCDAAHLSPLPLCHTMSSCPPPPVTFAPPELVVARPIESIVRSRRKLTQEDREAMSVRSRERNEIVDAAIDKFVAYADTVANELSVQCGNKPEYYRRLLFTGGSSRQKERKPNAYNAWVHHLAKEHNAGKSRLLPLRLLRPKEYRCCARQCGHACRAHQRA